MGAPLRIIKTAAEELWFYGRKPGTKVCAQQQLTQVKREEYASPSDVGTVQVAAECAPQAPSTPRPGLSPPSEVADGLLSSSFFVTLPPLPFSLAFSTGARSKSEIREMRLRRGCTGIPGSDSAEDLQERSGNVCQRGTQAHALVRRLRRRPRAEACWRAFNRRLSGEEGPLRRVCQFPWCKFSHHGRFKLPTGHHGMQTREEMHSWLSRASPHGPAFPPAPES